MQGEVGRLALQGLLQWGRGGGKTCTEEGKGSAALYVAETVENGLLQAGCDGGYVAVGGLEEQGLVLAEVGLVEVIDVGAGSKSVKGKGMVHKNSEPNLCIVENIGIASKISDSLCIVDPTSNHMFTDKVWRVWEAGWKERKKGVVGKRRWRVDEDRRGESEEIRVCWLNSGEKGMGWGRGC